MLLQVIITSGKRWCNYTSAGTRVSCFERSLLKPNSARTDTRTRIVTLSLNLTPMSIGRWLPRVQTGHFLDPRLFTLEGDLPPPVGYHPSILTLGYSHTVGYHPSVFLTLGYRAVCSFRKWGGEICKIMEVIN